MGAVSEPLPTWPRDSEEWRDYRDWQADAREGNTIMGFRDWVANREQWTED